LDDINNINNLNNRYKKTSYFIGNFTNTDNTLIKSNLIIYEWQTGRIIFSYVINSAIIELNYYDFTYEKMNNYDMDNIYKEKILIGNEFFKYYQENILNIFILGFKRNIYLLILKKSSVEINDLRLDGMINNDITTCKIIKKDRFFDNEEILSKKNYIFNNKEKKNLNKYEFNFFIITGHNDGSLISWEINSNGNNKGIKF